MRLVAVLSLPLAVAAAIVLLALPRRMNHLTEAWAYRASLGRATTTAGLVAADLDFDDQLHARDSLALLGAQGDVLGAVVRKADQTEFASWSPTAGAAASAMEVTVPVTGAGGAGGTLTVRFATATLDAQTARNRRLAWVIAVGVLLLGTVLSVGMTVQLRRATRATVRRELEAGFDLLVEDLPDGILIHRAGVVSYVNARGRALLAVDGPVRGLAVAALASPALDQLDDRPGVVELRTARGPRQVEVTRRPITFAGELSEVIVVRDVGDRERLRTRLEVTQRLASVGSLAAGVAHEINNPLTVIVCNLELLEQQVGEDPEALEMVAEATDATERVRRIVGDMRRLSRGDDDDRPAPFALGSAIQRALSLTAAEVRHHAEVQLESCEPDVVALGSESRFVQVLVNVLINASHAMASVATTVRTIRIAMAAHDQRVEVVIADQGVGMTPEVLARVFDPFFTTKEVGVGTGLGLPICHSLMTAMGGAITLASQVGVGTTVTMQLPAAPAVDAEALRARRTAPRPSAPPVSLPRVRTPTATGFGARPRILVIDDEPGIRATVERMLGDYRVTTAPSGAAALATVAGGDRFDLIVCDVLMPEMPGPAVRSSLERSVPEQARRLVYMTGGIDHRVEDLGEVAALLRKPFSQIELTQFVAANVARLAACAS